MQLIDAPEVDRWDDQISQLDYYTSMVDPLQWVTPESQVQTHVYADSLDLTVRTTPGARTYSIIETNNDFAFLCERIRVIYETDTIDLSFRLCQVAQAKEIVVNSNTALYTPVNFALVTTPSGGLIYREAMPLNVLVYPRQSLRLEISGYNGVHPDRIDIAYIGMWIPVSVRGINYGNQ